MDVGCFAKKQYRTYWQADRSARWLNKQQKGSRANAYKCQTCKMYHVGNTIKGSKDVKRSKTTI